MRARHCSLLCVVLVAASAWARTATGEELQTFVLKEYLDHNWSRELVEFALNAGAAGAGPGKLTLEGPNGQEVPFQLAGDPENRRIVFLADGSSPRFLDR